MKRILGNGSHGLLFVISAPAGTGKTTLAQMLIKEFSCIKESISCTTRLPRPDEREGDHYHFISQAEFAEKRDSLQFLEYAEVFGHSYGTLRSLVTANRERGFHVLLVIDTQGALQLKGKVDAIFIFIEPPSLDVLKERLLKRKTESQEMIAQRLSWAEKELEAKVHYDYWIVNDNLTIAYEVLRSILIAEEHKWKNRL